MDIAQSESSKNHGSFIWSVLGLSRDDDRRFWWRYPTGIRAVTVELQQGAT
jgi:hypothetical protein